MQYNFLITSTGVLPFFLPTFPYRYFQVFLQPQGEISPPPMLVGNLPLTPMGSLFHPFLGGIFARVLQDLVQEELVLSCQQNNASPSLISIITQRQQDFFCFFSNSNHDRCLVEAEHYLCNTISSVIAEFNGLMFPKQPEYTGNAACPEFYNISLKLLVLHFCGYKFQFFSRFPVKTFSLDKGADHKKGSSSQQSY